MVEGDSLQNCRVILRVGSNPTPSAKCWRGRMVQVKVCKTLDVGPIPTANSENFHHSSDVYGTVFDRKKVILGVVQLVERLLWEQEVFRRFEPCYPDKNNNLRRDGVVGKSRQSEKL